MTSASHARYLSDPEQKCVQRTMRLLPLVLVLAVAMLPAHAATQERVAPTAEQIAAEPPIPYWPSEREARMRELTGQIRHLQNQLFNARLAGKDREAHKLSRRLSKATHEFARLRSSLEAITAP